MRTTSTFIALLAATSFPQLANAQPRFVPLGPSPTGLPYRITGISPDGAVLIGDTQSPIGSTPLQWREDTGFSLPDPTFHGFVGSASNQAQTIVGTGWLPNRQAFQWRSGSGASGLGSLPDNRLPTTANDVSGDGSIIVGSAETGVPHVTRIEPVRWNAQEGAVAMGYLDPMDTRGIATAVSTDGSTIIGYSGGDDATSLRAWRWTAATGMLPIDTTNEGYSSIASAVSSDGSVIVGSGRKPNGGVYKFRWTESAGITRFESGAEALGTITDISGDGSIAVGILDSQPSSQAIIWDAAQGQRRLDTYLSEELGLDLQGWELRRAFGISDDGTRIAGEGLNPQGVLEGWMVVIPEPTSATFVILIIASATIIRKRRERSAR